MVSANYANEGFSHLFLRVRVMSNSDVPLYRGLANRGACPLEDMGHLVCGESTKTSCNTTIPCTGMFTTIQRNNPFVASFAKARNAAI